MEKKSYFISTNENHLSELNIKCFNYFKNNDLIKTKQNNDNIQPEAGIYKIDSKKNITRNTYQVELKVVQDFH